MVDPAALVRAGQELHPADPGEAALTAYEVAWELARALGEEPITPEALAAAARRSRGER